MTISSFLELLLVVRRSGRGWIANCPAHADRRPSLSICEGEQGLLVKCWAGCDLKSICRALGITPRKLFYDDSHSTDWESVQRRQAERRIRQAQERMQRLRAGRQADTRREAERFLAKCRDLDISTWSLEELNQALNLVCDAWDTLRKEADFYESSARAS